jgi:biopolymer transport protein ExbD
MLVSLSMVNLKGVKVNLPTATTSTTESKKDYVDVSVDKDGGVFLDKKPVGDNELIRTLVDQQKANPALRVFISGDADARHGRMIHVLDLIRTAGIDKVAFEIRQPPKGATP